MKRVLYKMITLSLLSIVTFSNMDSRSQLHIKSHFLTQIERLKIAIFLEEQALNTAYEQLKSAENALYEKLQEIRDELALYRSLSQFIPEIDTFIATLPSQKKPVSKIVYFVKNLAQTMKELGKEYAVAIIDKIGTKIEKMYQAYDTFKEVQSRFNALESDLAQEQGTGKKFREEL